MISVYETCLGLLQYTDHTIEGRGQQLSTYKEAIYTCFPCPPEMFAI